MSSNGVTTCNDWPVNGWMVNKKDDVPLEIEQKGEGVMLLCFDAVQKLVRPKKKIGGSQTATGRSSRFSSRWWFRCIHRSRGNASNRWSLEATLAIQHGSVWGRSQRYGSRSRTQSYKLVNKFCQLSLTIAYYSYTLYFLDGIFPFFNHPACYWGIPTTWGLREVVPFNPRNWKDVFQDVNLGGKTHWFPLKIPWITIYWVEKSCGLLWKSMNYMISL